MRMPLKCARGLPARCSNITWCGQTWPGGVVRVLALWAKTLLAGKTKNTGILRYAMAAGMRAHLAEKPGSKCARQVGYDWRRGYFWLAIKPSQSAKNCSRPIVVSGWLIICSMTLGGTVAMCAPSFAHCTTCKGLRTLAAIIWQSSP